MVSGMMLYFNIGAQAFSKEGFKLKELESVYLTGQALQGLVRVPAPLNLLNQTTKMG
jgi:hypothetical protein